MIQTATHDFIAHGELIRDDESMPVTITGTYPSFGPDSVQCTVIPETPGTPPKITPFIPGGGSQIRGRCEDGEKIWISELIEDSTTYSDGQVTWKGVARLFIKGNLDDFDSTGGSINCAAYIPPTPLAIANVGYVPSYDGTIRFQDDKARVGMRWATKWGEAELIDNYQYTKDNVKLNSALIRIQRCQVNFRLVSQGVTSLREIINELRGVLDDALWFVSFLSRRRIAWYSAEAVFIPGDGPTKRFQKAIAHRQQWLGYHSETEKELSWTDLLITPNTLRDGLLQPLLDSYQSSPHKAVIRRTIPYILVSYETGYFEGHIGSAYSAIESLVDGLDSDEGGKDLCILDFEQFVPLVSKLKSTIESEVKDTQVARALTKNLHKLNRTSNSARSFVDKLLGLLSEKQVPVNRVWPAGADLQEELREIRRRRDIYIHQGAIDDLNQYYNDFVRIRTLVELWILKLLDCPDSAINYRAIEPFLAAPVHDGT